jgi:PIN domain nuclease of toxin-antitoxin system
VQIGDAAAPEELPGEIVDAGFGWLAVGAEHAWAVRDLPLHHRDPFDRLLIAQALDERIPLVTAHGEFAAYGVKTCW